MSDSPLSGIRALEVGPRLGEDTRTVLQELGVSNREIDELVRERVTTEPTKAFA